MSDRESSGSGRILDLIGLGAINEDYYWNATPPRRVQSILPPAFEPRREPLMSDAEVDQILEGSGAFFKVTSGGSALNVIQTVQKLGLGLHAGFVGVQGLKSRTNQVATALDGLDKTFLLRDENKPPGRCVVFRSGDSRLVTSPGANLRICEALRAPGLAKYLGHTRWIHITSFHDRASIPLIVGLVSAAREINPSLVVSFDPGDEYAERAREDIRPLIRASNYMFLNYREFLNLGGAGLDSRPTVEQIAQRIFKDVLFEGQILVLKTTGSHFVLHKSGTSLCIRRWWHRWVPGIFIRDDVGAGDVFAGGFIAAHLSPLFSEFGRGPIELGSSLVRARLTFEGAIPFDRFAPIVEDLTKATAAHERLNSRQLIATYGPSFAKAIAAVLTGVIATLVYQWIFGK